MRERWRPVVGFEGQYAVSDQGRVKSLARLVRAGKGFRPVAERILRPAPSKSGHMSVVIGKGNTQQVHQLVMCAFAGPCPSGHEVLHLNHTPSDNRRRNLKYGTRGENIAMDHAIGRRTVSQAFIYSDNGTRREGSIVRRDV